ncbi:hypothetical protein [Methanobrevibacter sp.]|uniref:hypothetical protein n=1 Tax=Methanobrevibacter sp. TaxID=66852 RepID=UPI003D7D94E5
MVYIRDLVKICRNCGHRYPKDYNYCTKCDSNEKLTVNIKELKTNPNKYYGVSNYSNNFEDIYELFTQTNIDKLNKFNLTQLQFENIISNIKKTYKSIINYLLGEYQIDLKTLTALDKILLFSKSFVKTDYKEGGGDLGHFKFNEIFIDDRATDALQITTLIHELSHFLMAEILEQIVSEILDTNKTGAVEAFVAYILSKNNLNYLVDEYCAHTVEGRFAVFGYQDYGSYEQCLLSFKSEFGEELIDVANQIGNTFAFYIKDIMESFIDEKLRNDIKQEFSRINDIPKYSQLQYETSMVFDWEAFYNVIKLMLTADLKVFVNDPAEMEKLELYTNRFKE